MLNRAYSQISVLRVAVLKALQCQCQQSWYACRQKYSWSYLQRSQLGRLLGICKACRTSSRFNQTYIAVAFTHFGTPGMEPIFWNWSQRRCRIKLDSSGQKTCYWGNIIHSFTSCWMLHSSQCFFCLVWVFGEKNFPGAWKIHTCCYVSYGLELGIYNW